MTVTMTMCWRSHAHCIPRDKVRYSSIPVGVVPCLDDLCRAHVTWQAVVLLV